MSQPPPNPSPAPAPARPPVKPSILPKLLIGGGVSMVLFVGILGVAYWTQHRAKPGKASAEVVVHERAAQAQARKPEKPLEDEYGDTTIGAAGAKDTGALADQRRKAQERASSMLSGDMDAPDVWRAGMGGSAKTPATDDYGDEGDGYTPAERMALPAGRPRTPPREKDELPEQYFADISPWKKPPPPPPARSDADTARFGPGQVLGGPATNRATPEVFAPGGRVVPCELVFAVDSTPSSTGHMIVATTTKDLVFQNRVVIPAGSEVIGSVGNAVFESSTLGRIFDSGEWRIILPHQPGKPAGRELRVMASAHYRAETAVTAAGKPVKWDREMDGRPGLPGRVVSIRDQARWKALAWNTIGSIAQQSLGTYKDQRQSGGFAGGYEDSPTMSNVGVSAAQSAVQGGASTMAQQYMQDAERLTEYVSVGSGLKFYLFISSTVLPEDATTGRASATRWEQSRRPQATGDVTDEQAAQEALAERLVQSAANRTSRPQQNQLNSKKP